MHVIGDVSGTDPSASLHGPLAMEKGRRRKSRWFVSFTATVDELELCAFDISKCGRGLSTCFKGHSTQMRSNGSGGGGLILYLSENATIGSDDLPKMLTISIHQIRFLFIYFIYKFCLE